MVVLVFFNTISMLDNHAYNLIEQLSQEHKSLWRIKDMYLSDSANCSECAAFWRALADQKEAQISTLRELVKKHLG